MSVFLFTSEKPQTIPKTAQFREHYQLHEAAILLSFALITHYPPTSVKTSICSFKTLPVSETNEKGAVQAILWVLPFGFCLSTSQVKMKEQLGYSESSHWNSGSGNFARRYCHGYIWLASAKLKRSFQNGKKLLEGACDW